MSNRYKRSEVELEEQTLVSDDSSDGMTIVGVSIGTGFGRGFAG
jgi:hypothetical protein